MPLIGNETAPLTVIEISYNYLKNIRCADIGPMFEYVDNWERICINTFELDTYQVKT